MKIKALLVAAVLAGEFGLCFASTDGDLIQGVIPYPDSVCLKITRVREAQGASWVTQTNVKPLFSEEACRKAAMETPSRREHLLHQD